jgi:Uma2 family endonuclease
MTISTGQPSAGDSGLAPTKSSSLPTPSAAPTRSPRKYAPPPYPIHRFTVAEYEEIGRLGILDEDSNVELLEGWIVPKMTKYPPHDNTIDLLNFLLSRLLPSGWFVRVQNCVVTPDSIPEPDIAVVRGTPGNYQRQHPAGGDVGLIIEVADSTVRRDRRKARIYARAGIPLYWIINLDQAQIEVHSQPMAAGSGAVYQSRQILRGADDALTVILDGVPVGNLVVRDLLS